MSTKVVIQINSLDALEKLLSDHNGEITVELKQAVVQEFTKKHLKAVATEKMMQDATEAAKNWLHKEYFDEIKEKHQWKPTIVWKQQTVDLLKDYIGRVGRDSVKHWVEELVGIDNLKERVDAALVNATTLITTALTDEHLESRLNILVDKKLQQMADLASKLK